MSFKGLLFIMRRIFLQRLDDGVILLGIDDADALATKETSAGGWSQHSTAQTRASHRDLAVTDILEEDLGANLFLVDGSR